ncbi:glycoprotein precursor [Kaisodi virus]|uniref:Envelopment polyprotein n=1 Tax=Kaisodi virus TaxID=1564120 RepID=A0A384ZKF3_9VIRU|nr:glycoprotein precursor [Kaisodi virus]AWW17496.1 glycoprotein precursor [Kaisodi virus]
MSMMRIVIIVILLPASLAFLADLIQHIQKASQPEKKQFLQSLPSSHELTKGLVQVPTGLEASKIGFLPVHNYTDKLEDGVSRETDCSGGKTSFFALDPVTKKISNLTCEDGKILSKDCSSCESGRPTVLKPPFPQVFYDDMICQFESEASRRIKQPQNTFCSVGGVSLRDCKGVVENTVERITWMMLKETIIFLEDHSVSWREGPWYSLFDCKKTEDNSQCDLTECKAGKCSGDTSYCSQFTCQKTSPVCRCTRNLIPGILHVTIGDNTVIPSCFGHSKWVVKRTRRLQSVLAPKACLDCSVECKQDNVLVIVRHFTPGYYQMCLGPVCYTGQATGKEFKIPIHPMSRISTEEVTLQMWSDTKSERYDLQAICHHMSACDLINCFFCSANWVNIHCFGKEKWILISLILSLVCLLVGMVLKAIQRIVGFLAWALGPMVWIFKILIKFSGKKMRRHFTRARLALTELEREDSEPLITVTTERTRPPHELSSTRQERMSRKSKALLLVSILSIIQNAGSCSDSIKLTSLAKDCKQVAPSKYVCTFSSTTLLPAAPIGQTSCLLLTSQAGETLGIMKIKTLEARLTCLKSDLYWIPKATHQCLGSRRCRLVGNCVNDECMKMTENDYSSEWGARETVMSRLGWSSCNPQCGGLVCGCFNVNPSCFYLRKTFVNPESLVFKGFECPSWTYSLKVKISFNDTTQDVSLVPDVPFKTNWGKIQISSISSAPNLGYAECFFIAPNGQIFHSPCNRRGEVSTGKLGEIQCPTASDAMQISPNCFSDQSLIHHTINKDVVHCSSQLLDPTELQKKNRLPSTIGNTIFYPGGDTVYASSSTRISASLLLKLNDVAVESVTDRNKCSSRFLNLTGCYNCEAGAILRMETVTDFGTADAILECPRIQLLTYFVSSSVLTISEVIIHLNQSKIRTDCKITCPNSQESIRIEGELVYIQDVDFRHHNETTTPIVQRGKGGIDWFGWLHFSWMQWVWYILGIGGIIICAVISFFLLKHFCCKIKIF